MGQVFRRSGVGIGVAALMLAWAVPAWAVQAGINIDIHQDVPCDPAVNCPNDFHIEGRICSKTGSPTLLDHIDDLFVPSGSFSYTITPVGPAEPCWYTFTADWARPAGIPYCTILHLGLLFEVDAANVLIDLRGWWTRNGVRIGDVVPELTNGGFVPVLGFDVNGTSPQQYIRIANRSIGLPPPNPPLIPIEIVALSLVSCSPITVVPFKELNVNGRQQQLQWVPVLKADGSLISETNPLPVVPDSFFDIYFEVPMPGHPRPATQIQLPPGNFLLSKQLVRFTNNSGEVEQRWVFDIHQQPTQELEFGDAPEDAIAYPPAGIGTFPTCLGGTAPWIQHGFPGARWLGPTVDPELDGNAGQCAPPGLGFPPYDFDECFADGDAGLTNPGAYTIDATNTVVLCPTSPGGSLGLTCTTATWGPPGIGNVDILVQNPGPSSARMNVLMDWDQNGIWAGASTCPGGAAAPEHVLVNFVIPAGYVGLLSGVIPAPPPFLIGPNPGYVWTRFSITPVPVALPWDGSGNFQDGETEDYLLRVEPGQQWEHEFGDAPEGALAYSAGAVVGLFPTCLGGPAGFIDHMFPTPLWLGPGVDPEIDGNAGLCAPPGLGFPPYDADECFGGGDAGLITPPSYTIAGGVEVPCVAGSTGTLGVVCTLAAWGAPPAGRVDIIVNNTSTADAYMNVLMDWNQNGAWAGASVCPGTPGAPEHVLINWLIPAGYVGPLSLLGPPPFRIGPNPGYVWTRFSITPVPVALPWDGSGSYDSGETEDYLLRVQNPITITGWRTLRTHTGYGEFGIVLNPAQSGNGGSGPRCETRGTGTNAGMRNVRVDFSAPVTLISPAAITVTGRTTVGGVMGLPVGYGFTAAMFSPTTLQLLFTVPPLPPDETCYNINIGAGTFAEVISGDPDCNVRGLSADANMSGDNTLADALLIKSKIGLAPSAWPHCDANLGGGITIADALYAKGRIGRKALCP